jgi:hypothetical protein
MRIAIAGASGLIGTALCADLARAGHEVCRLVRGGGVEDALRVIPWDPARSELDSQALAGHDVVVNLAGASIGEGRWSTERKRVILESRVRATTLISHALAVLAPPRPVLINASATGYYGNRPPAETLDESAAPGSGFLAQVTQSWEAATGEAQAAGVRVVCARLGVVLSARGGALARMLPLFRAGLGGRLGGGAQVLSWIALPEIAPALLHAVQQGLSGPVNFTAPGAVSNAQLTRALGQALHRPALAAVPAALLRLLLGEQAGELLLSGARAVPRKLLDSGYVFRYPELEAALSALLGREG